MTKLNRKPKKPIKLESKPIEPIPIWQAHLTSSEVLSASVQSKPYFEFEQFYVNTSQREKILYEYVIASVPNKELTSVLKRYLFQDDSSKGLNTDMKLYSKLICTLVESAVIDWFTVEDKQNVLKGYIRSCLSFWDGKKAPEVIKRLLAKVKFQNCLRDFFFVLCQKENKEGQKVHIDELCVNLESYMFILLVQSSLVLRGKQLEKDSQCPIMILVQNFFNELLSLSEPSHKSFLLNLVPSCIILLSSSHFVSHRLLTIISHIANNNILKHSLLEQSNPLSSQLIHSIGQECSWKLKDYVSFERLKLPQKEVAACNFCLTEKKKAEFLILNKKNQVYKLVICKMCRVSGKKQMDKKMANILDLGLILWSREKGSINYEEERIIKTMNMHQFLCPLKFQSQLQKQQYSRLFTDILHAQIDSKISFIRPLVHNALLFASPIIGIEQHINTSVRLWMLSTTDNLIRIRIKSLKNFKFYTLFKVNQMDNPPPFVANLLDHIINVLKNRLNDVVYDVRKQAMLVLIQIFRMYQYKEIQILDQIKQTFKDKNVDLRRYITFEIKKIINKIAELDHVILIGIVVLLLEAMDDGDEKVEMNACDSLVCVLNKRLTHQIVLLQWNEWANSKMNLSMAKNYVKALGNCKIHYVPYEISRILIKNGMNGCSVQNRVDQITILEAYFLEQLALSSPKPFFSFTSPLAQIIIQRLSLPFLQTKPTQLKIIIYLLKTLCHLVSKLLPLCSIYNESFFLVVKALYPIIHSSQHIVFIDTSVITFIKLNIHLKNNLFITNMYSKNLVEAERLLPMTLFDAANMDKLFKYVYVVSIAVIAITQSTGRCTQQFTWKVYELLYKLVQCPRASIKSISMYCMIKFWPINNKFLIASHTILDNIFSKSLQTESIIISLYDGLQMMVDKVIKQQNEEGISLITNMFLCYFNIHYTIQHIETRFRIISIIQTLIQYGKISARAINQVVLSYLCDSDKLIRQKANKLVKSMQIENIFVNFEQTINDVIQYNEKTHGEMNLGQEEDKSFFENLINNDTRREKEKKTDRAQPSLFILKLCENVQSQCIGTDQKHDKRVQFFCRIILKTEVFGFNDYKNILNVLQRLDKDNESRIKRAIDNYREELKSFPTSNQRKSITTHSNNIGSTSQSNLSNPISSNYSQVIISDPVRAWRVLYLVNQTIHKFPSYYKPTSVIIKTKSIQVKLPNNINEIDVLIKKEQQQENQDLISFYNIGGIRRRRKNNDNIDQSVSARPNRIGNHIPNLTNENVLRQYPRSMSQYHRVMQIVYQYRENESNQREMNEQLSLFEGLRSEKKEYKTNSHLKKPRNNRSNTK